MISPLSLSNGLTLLFAGLCLWTIALQARGGTTTLGRVALPGGFAVMAALMLLASVIETSVTKDVLWIFCFVGGSFIGRIRGWRLQMQADKMSGRIALPPTIDGVLAAVVLVGLSAIDFLSSMFGQVYLDPAYIAAGSALCAGFLGYRVLVIALRVVRPGPADLSRTA